MPGFFLACLLLAPPLAWACCAPAASPAAWRWRRTRRLPRIARRKAAAAASAWWRGNSRGRASRCSASPPACRTAPRLEVAAAAQQMLRLSDDIAEYLAVEAGPRRLAPEPLPLIPLLEDAVAEVAIRLGAGRRDWRLAGGFAGLTLQADRRALHGALTQVLARAARMTREGEQIDLRPVLTGGYPGDRGGGRGRRPARRRPRRRGAARHPRPRLRPGHRPVAGRGAWRQPGGWRPCPASAAGSG